MGIVQEVLHELTSKQRSDDKRAVIVKEVPITSQRAASF